VEPQSLENAGQAIAGNIKVKECGAYCFPAGGVQSEPTHDGGEDHRRDKRDGDGAPRNPAPVGSSIQFELTRLPSGCGRPVRCHRSVSYSSTGTSAASDSHSSSRPARVPLSLSASTAAVTTSVLGEPLGSTRPNSSPPSEPANWPAIRPLS